MTSCLLAEDANSSTDLFGDAPLPRRRRLSLEEHLEARGLREVLIRRIARQAKRKQRAAKKTPSQHRSQRKLELRKNRKHKRLYREAAGNGEAFTRTEILWLHGRLFEDAIEQVAHASPGSPGYEDAFDWICGSPDPSGYGIRFETCAGVLGFQPDEIRDGLKAFRGRKASRSEDLADVLAEIRSRVQALARFARPVPMLEAHTVRACAS